MALCYTFSFVPFRLAWSRRRASWHQRQFVAPVGLTPSKSAVRMRLQEAPRFRLRANSTTGPWRIALRCCIQEFKQREPGARPAICMAGGLTCLFPQAGNQSLGNRRHRRGDRRQVGSRPASLLQSQSDTLAEPDADEHPVTVRAWLAEWVCCDSWAHRQPRAPHQRACLAIWARAACTTCSGVNPNFVCRPLSGAEAPKVCIPITAPWRPT